LFETGGTLGLAIDVLQNGGIGKHAEAVSYKPSTLSITQP
jgi:hypothetical protein